MTLILSPSNIYWRCLCAETTRSGRFSLTGKRRARQPGQMALFPISGCDLGFRRLLPIFIGGFLPDRLFKVRLDSTLSDLHEQEMGVPQGSILSPALFSIEINDIVKYVLNKEGTDASLFVDDFAFWIRGKSVQRAERDEPLLLEHYYFSDLTDIRRKYCHVDSMEVLFKEVSSDIIFNFFLKEINMFYKLKVFGRNIPNKEYTFVFNFELMFLMKGLLSDCVNA